MEAVPSAAVVVLLVLREDPTVPEGSCVIVKEILTPATGLPEGSVTVTVRESGSVVLTNPSC